MQGMAEETESQVEGEIAVLRSEMERLQAENRGLREQITQLSAELAAALKLGGKQVPAFVKANRPKREGEEQPRKKRAAKHNTSRKRSEPTRIEKHSLERCPDCQYELRGKSINYTREVIELPPPQPVDVIEHQVVKRWCPCCKAWRSPKLDLSGQVIGQGRIGTRIAGLVAYLRTTLRLPVRKIQEYLATLHNLDLSVGEIAELSHKVGSELEPYMKALRAEVQTSPIVHADETGWREDGQNGYVWAFVTPGEHPIRYFVYQHSRSHRVPQGVLGLHLQGHLVSDFYAAYNLLRGPHQRCWAHLLRDLHALKEAHAETSEVLSWAKAVRKLYDEAQAWLTESTTLTVAQRQDKYANQLSRVCTLGRQYALVSKHPCQTLAKRLMRHQE